MKFRLRAFGLHLLASAGVLALIFGALYLGWYRWPGWYLAGVSVVVFVMVGVDLVIGPTLTLVVANGAKPRRELMRDISIIAAVQLAALIYGALSIWNGRPMYYAYSEGVLQMVQAFDLKSEETVLGRRQNPRLAPYWYSVPRWVWAPLPQDPEERDRIVKSAISGDDDVISMPRYFKSWEQGLPALRRELKPVDAVAYFAPAQKKILKERMRAAGFAPDQPIAMPLTGREKTLLAVFDPASAAINAFIKAD